METIGIIIAILTVICACLFAYVTMTKEELKLSAIVVLFYGYLLIF